MKIYLVGGAVRDQLLDYPVQERDWVVVGATPEEMMQQRFRQVGRDFPVFLHPSTQEEYALARTEKKSGTGYKGFVCNSSPEVTLEQDLSRRDLTINAIARDEKGHLIDPFNGVADLHNKYLRHVSEAFVEDPVRVLRVARFAARYHHLGFRVAPETRQLMYQMVKKGEVAHLVAERVWLEWEKSLKEKDPDLFITTLRSCDALRIIFPEIHALFGVPNPVHYHPEIDSGIHTLLVLQAAAKQSTDPLTRFAAVTHDLGKAITPWSLLPKHHQHEETGVPIINTLCDRLRIPTAYRQLAILSSKLHLRIHRIEELRASTIVKTFEVADAFRKPERFEQLLRVCEADAQGTGQERQYTQSEKWRKLLKAVEAITSASLIPQYQGEAIKLQLHQLRVDCIQQLI